MSKPWVNRIDTFARMKGRGKRLRLQALAFDTPNAAGAGVGIVGVETGGRLAVEHFRGR